MAKVVKIIKRRKLLNRQVASSPAGQLPCLYGALIFYIPASAITISEVAEFLPNVTLRVFSSEIEVTYREIRKIYSWEVETLLEKLFSICDFEEIAFIQSKFGGKALIDISFHHYDAYPVLTFCGRNMEIIRNLNADISIDPY